MPRAADGTMSLSGTFAIPNAIPVAGTINGYISDITTELTDSWSRSGKGAALAHLSMGNFKMTLLADGVALTDAANVKQVQNGTVAWADGGGTADAITATYSPAVTAVVDGMRLRVRAPGANTVTTPTFAPNGLTARTIKKLNGLALAGGDIAGDEHDLDLTYVATGTYWNLNNPATATSVSGAVAATSLSASGAVSFTGDITPAQITANQNNYAPTGHATATVFRLSTDASRSLTGLAGGADGRIVELQNIGSFNLALNHEDGSSSAANQFTLPDATSLTIGPRQAIELIYDSTVSLWRLRRASFNLATQAIAEAASSIASVITPFSQQYHPGHPKWWAYVAVSAGTPTTQASYNVTSITDDGVGDLTVTIATDFSSADWAPIATVGATAGAQLIANYNAIAAGTINFECNSDAGTATDPVSWAVMGLGDQ